MRLKRTLVVFSIVGQIIAGLSISTAGADESSALSQQQLVILGGKTSQAVGYGQADSNMALSLDGGQTWGPAYLSETSSHLRGYGYRSGTDAWVNCNPNPNPCPNNGEQIIRTSFYLPTEFDSIQVTINALIDDVGYFSLNGNQFWIGGVETRSFSLTQFAKAGLNNLDVRVVNGGGEVGINFRYDISANANGPMYQVQTRFSTPILGPVSVLGEVYTGQTLEARLGSTLPDVILSYQWLRGGAEIQGAIAATYVPTAEDIGNLLQVRVTATNKNSRYDVASRLSDPISISDGALFKTLTIAGGLSGPDNPMGGPDKYLSLSTDNGNSWGPAYISPNATYLRMAGPVPGTDAWVNCNPNEWGCRDQIIQAKFNLPQDYSNIRLKIFASADNFGEFFLNDNKILECTDFSCTSGRDLNIGNFARPGLNIIKVRVLDYGVETGINFKYQFSMNSSQAPTLMPAKFVFPTVQTPTVSGYHKVGSTLSAAVTSLPRGASARYQWIRDGVAIAGADGTRYTPVLADVGRNLSFQLTLSGNAYDDLILTTDARRVFPDGPELNPDNGHYYQFIPFTGNWFEAQRYAHSLEFKGVRGHMSTITSEEENKFVSSVADGNVIYLPSYLTPRNGKNYWIWTDGAENGKAIAFCNGRSSCISEPGAYTNWDTQLNQPDMSGEPVLVMRTTSEWSFDSSRPRIQSGLWGDCGVNCAQGFVVEFDLDWRMFIGENIIKAGPNHYYKLVQESVNYADALRLAKSSSFAGLQGHLVTVESNSENSLVSMLASGRAFWIAARDIGQDATAFRNWIWDSGPNQGKEFMSCRGTSDCSVEGFEYSTLAMNGYNGYGTWESVIQSGGINAPEVWNDCAMTLDQCPQINSYIIEYELDPALSVTSPSGDWVSVNANLALPGQPLLITAHLESGAGSVKVSASGNPTQTLPLPDGYGNTYSALTFNLPGMKNILVIIGKKRLSIKVWVASVTVRKRLVKLGSSFSVSVSSVAPGTRCTLLASDGRAFEAIANASGRATFVIPAQKVGGLIFNLSAGNLVLDSQGVTVTR